MEFVSVPIHGRAVVVWWELFGLYRGGGACLGSRNATVRRPHAVTGQGHTSRKIKNSGCERRKEATSSAWIWMRVNPRIDTSTKQIT
jgi:hypothetical protein